MTDSPSELPRSPRVATPVGLIFVIVGLALAVIGTFAVPWATSGDAFTPAIRYADLMSRAVSADSYQVSDEDEFAVAYFAYIGVLILAVVALFSLLGTWPATFGRRRRVHRSLAATACLIAVAALFTAVGEISDSLEPAAGPWIAALGYVLVFVGIVIGPSTRGYS